MYLPQAATPDEKNHHSERPLKSVDNLTIASPYHSARRRDNPSRCRATRVSAPSRSLPKPRSRTVPSPSGFASGLVTPSDTTLSGGTGARPVSVSKREKPGSCFPPIEMLFPIVPFDCDTANVARDG